MILFLVLLGSCNTYEKKLKGAWFIEQIDVIDNGNEKYNVSSNVIMLNEDNTCKMPLTDFKQRNTEFERGTWEVKKHHEGYNLIIASKNPLFAGDFSVDTFYTIKDVTGGFLDKVFLRSNRLYLACAKQH